MAPKNNSQNSQSPGVFFKPQLGLRLQVPPDVRTTTRRSKNVQAWRPVHTQRAVEPQARVNGAEGAQVGFEKDPLNGSPFSQQIID